MVIKELICQFCNQDIRPSLVETGGYYSWNFGKPAHEGCMFSAIGRDNDSQTEKWSASIYEGGGSFSSDDDANTVSLGSRLILKNDSQTETP